VREDHVEWDKIITLLQLSKYDEEIIEQYRTSKNLDVRIQLHEKYSHNKLGWFNWLYSQLDFSHANRILEIGCGDGKLWENKTLDFRNREVFLSDASSGMIEEVKKKLGDDFSFMIFDCEQIPFKKNYFDIVIANHVLFYLKDLNLGLKEVERVLVEDGSFYCSTYGKNHMKEITELVKEFDSRIVLSRNCLYDQFGIENGKDILNSYFKNVDLVMYDDYLEVDDSEPLIDYIMSCHGNQNEILKNQLHQFKLFLDQKIMEKGHIRITKQAGLFKCKK